MANGFEIAKRREKVTAMVRALDSLVSRCELDPQEDWPIVVNVLRGWSEKHWVELAVSCGKQPPSETTKRMVIERLEARARKAS